jgi:hypothetical protein
VRLGLHNGIFAGELCYAVPDQDDQISLFGLRAVLEGLGINPALTVVEATRPDDARTRSAGSSRWRPDRGHEAEGPHEEIQVRAKRRW